MKREKKRKVLIGRVFDLLIIPAYIVISILFIYLLKSYTNKYTIIAVVVLALILIISLLTLLYRKNAIHYMRRFLLTVLCAIMVFGSFKINSLDRLFRRLGNDEEAEVITTTMNLYSLKSNDHFTSVVNTMDDLEGKTVGVQSANDKEESNYVLDQIEDNYKVKKLEYNDYKTMFTDLYNGYVDAIIVNADATSGIAETFGAPLDEFTIQLKTYTHEKTIEINTVDKDITSEIFTVLISGQDDVGTPNENSLSDVNMLAIINPKSNQLTFISIPRDSFVLNPAFDYANDKLTHTGWEGVQNTMKSLEATLQLDIDFYVKISFTSLIEIVDAVDGIEADIPFFIEEQDENRSFLEDDLIRLNPGVQALNGKQALAFARHRHGYADQDLGRSQAQMQVIKGITKKLLTVEGLNSRIEKVLDIVPNYVLTNFSNSQMKRFIKDQIDNLKPWAITNLSLANGYAPGPEGYVPTASDPNTNQSVYYLSEREVFNVNAFYNMIQEPHTFSEFSFDLNNLYDGLSTYDETKYDIEFAD